MAAEEGGTFFVAYGAVIWGLVSFFIGMVGWLKYRAELRRNPSEELIRRG